MTPRAPRIRTRRPLLLPVLLAVAGFPGLAALTACDSGPATPAPPPAPIGSVSGRVSVEGSSVQGVTVQLSGATSSTTTTGADGSYSFGPLGVGTYSVTLSSVPADYTFPAVTQTVQVQLDARDATADFAGQWVRTASLLVSVRRADGTPVNTNVQLQGEGEDRTQGTNTQGVATFSELKRGTYDVRLLAAPDDFTTTEQQITLGTGESVPLNFVGDEIRIPPEISIVGLTEITPSGTEFSGERISAPFRVDVEIEPNDNTVEAVELRLRALATGDVWRVATQQGSAAFDFSFDVNPAARRLRDGSHPVIERLSESAAAPVFEPVAPDAQRPYHPLFVDGDYELQALVHVAELDEPVAAALDVRLISVPAPDAFPLPPQLRFDHAIVRVEADNTDWLDPATAEPFPSVLVRAVDGTLWHSGDLHLDAYPVVYSQPSTAAEPWITEMALSLDSIEGGSKAPPLATETTTADGSLSWLLCEHEQPNHDPEALCDASVADLLGSQLEVAISTATRGGGSGFSAFELRFDDDAQGLEPFLRVDNRAPSPGALSAAALPHPANAIEGVSLFRRTPRSGATHLGWVTWTDSLGRTVVDPGFMADSSGIGMPGTLDDQPQLIYVLGPDALAPEAGVPGTLADIPTHIVAAEGALQAFNTLTAADLPPETDRPELTTLGSAPGTPFSDADDDYLMTALHWDRFGNRTPAAASGGLAGFLRLGVDGAAPRFVDATGSDRDPSDPVDTQGRYNPYDSGIFVTSTSLADGGGLYGTPVIQAFRSGRGAYEGWTTDATRGFAGVEGVVIEDWALGNGAQPGPSRFGWQRAEGALMDWTFSAGAGPINDFTIAAYAERLQSNTVGSAYRQHRAHSYDRAGNVTITPASREHIVDQTPPVLRSPSQPPGPYRLGEFFTFEVPISDEVDLKRTDVGPEFLDEIFADLTTWRRPHVAGVSGELAARPSHEVFVLPLVEYAHTPWGSSASSPEVLLRAEVPLDVCLSVFDREGHRPSAERASWLAVRTWDHASPYGLWGYRSVSIESGYPSSAQCFAAGQVDENFELYQSRGLVWDFEVDASRRPVIRIGGPTSTFVPEVGPDDLTLYYQDVSGRLRRIDPEDVEWVLNVSDTGGSEEDARTYRYTYVAPLPADLIDEDDVAPGTHGGFTFTWQLGGGNLLIWSEGWSRDP